MDDMIADFLTETNEAVAKLDVHMVELEKNPNNPELINDIFRLVHTIKGTCGFLGLPRLEKLAHSAENVLGLFRSGEAIATPDTVTAILKSFDRIKYLLDVLGETGAEPAGDDRVLVTALDRLAAQTSRPQLMNASPEAIDAALAATAKPEAAAEPEDLWDSIQVPEESASAVDAVVAAVQVAVAAVEKEKAANDAVVEAVQEAEKAAAHVIAAVQEAEAVAAQVVDAAKEVTSRALEAAEPEEVRVAKSEGNNAPQSVRVNVDLLDKLMTLVGELVLARNQVLQITRGHQASELTGAVQNISHVTSELQESVMKTRMQPVGNAWIKLPRIIRDLAHDLGKKINLEMTGNDTEVDRQVLELIKDPLTHMVRNCADHAIELPAERKAAGKPETGTIRIGAYHEGGHIVVSVADDGRGLASKKILAKAIERGLTTEAEAKALSANRIREFIFHPGFSTAAQVTSVSGRGVGMDVVKTNVEKIGGTVEVDSAEGQGTTFCIKIPLTLAIVSALIVDCQGSRYALPQLNVSEIVMVAPGAQHAIERIKDAQILRLRERILPLVSLAKALGLPGGGSETKGNVLVCRAGNGTFGIIVDGVYDTEEIVVKPLSKALKDVAVFSGNTILGDGSVVMILDPNGLAMETGVTANGRSTAAVASKADHASNETGGDAVQLLLFRAGDGAPKAIPLSLVARLEQIDTKRIEPFGERAVVQYLDKLMPIVGINGLRPQPKGETMQMIVFVDGKRAMGLAVDEIVEIVESEIRIDLIDRRPGVLGGAILDGRATDVVDMSYYLDQVFGGAARSGEGTHEDTGLGAGKRVLVVDDSDFFRGMVASLLKTRGFTVVEAADAAEALGKLGGEKSFDVVLSDIEMPGMNGFEFATKVKADPRTKDIPMVALTAHSTVRDIEQGQASGFDAHVGKFDRDAMFRHLAKLAH